ncbi:uncharacterized protein LOC122655150 [Telopea speciosissima]|uniref:uncharacterized protein LOC122655150 n=1 Tax=Telopea speciosissima TaxID=54955 RepID=UPI001CC72C22|nr:uncharacterized protein LOC122655150 [Telopea speciosissima]
MMERFKKLQPPSFSRIGTDPLQPKRWISALEKAFEVLECSDAQKLICARYQLQNEAEAWWKSTKPNLMMTHPNPTWDQFKEVFFGNFFPTSFRDGKEAEFVALTQESKLVLDYQQQFEDLFHFAPEHIRTEACKSKKFEKGLKPDIGAILVVHDIQSYAQMVGKAKTTEDRLKEKTLISQGSGKRANTFQNYNWPNKTFKGSGYNSNPTQYRRPEVNQASQSTQPLTSQSTRYNHLTVSQATIAAQPPRPIAN